MRTTLNLTKRPLPGARQPENWTGMKTRLEHWRPVVEYEGLYEVSDLGRVRSLPRMTCRGVKGGRILNPIRTACGYLHVFLPTDGKQKWQYIHRLVGMAFPDLVGWTEKAKGRPFEELEINHKDQNKENNRVENLEWCDGLYNLEYGDARERMAKTLFNLNDRQINQYTAAGCPIRQWNSLIEIEKELKFDLKKIRQCCLGYLKTAYNYQWRYASEVEYDTISSVQGHAVVQFTKSGEKIAVYESAVVAAKQNNICKNNIWKACRKEIKTSGGYQWRYASEVEGLKQITPVSRKKSKISK